MRCRLNSLVAAGVAAFLVMGVTGSARGSTLSEDDYQTAECWAGGRFIGPPDIGTVVFTAGHCPVPPEVTVGRWTYGHWDVAAIYPDYYPEPDGLADDLQQYRETGHTEYDSSNRDESVYVMDPPPARLCKIAGSGAGQCSDISTFDYSPRGFGWSADAEGFLVLNGTFCAVGDSGGPWLVQGGDQDGAFYGVTSGGLGTRSANTLGYTAGSCIVSRAYDLPWTGDD